MGESFAAAIAVAIAVLALAGGAAAAPAPGFTELVSVSSSGVQGNQDSDTPAVSADGRFVAFVSLADNLVPGDTNVASDIFVRDRLLGATERVSVSSAGRQADGFSGIFNGMGDPDISADGRFVVFDSEATNLVKGDTNGTADVFVHDRATGTTERVSVTSSGAQSGGGAEGDISRDGNVVAFISFADDLVQPDTNFAGDVFVHNRTTGTTMRVSNAPDGSEADSSSFDPDLDENGTLVAYSSFASNLTAAVDGDGSADVFVTNVATGATESISGTTSTSFGHSTGAAITPDGRFVVFNTQDPTLVPGDTNGFRDDVLIFDRIAHTFEIVSVNDAGTQGDDVSSQGVASADGRFVAFTSFATNMVPEDTNFRLDVFVRDRVLHTTRRVSVGSAGEEGDLDSLAPSIDADGRVIAFSSHSSTFVPESGQDFFASDVFVRDARPPADLALMLADSPDPVTIRGELTYTATITNSGPTPATGVTLVAELPADATFVSAAGATCTRGGKGKSDGTLTCAVGTIAAGSSATVTILVRPTRAGTLTLTARVRADQPDPDGSDNSATETTTVVR